MKKLILLFILLSNYIFIPLVINVANADEVKTQSSDSSKNSFAPFEKDKNAPIRITSDSVRVDNNKRLFEYIGNVVVTRSDLILKSNTMSGKYNEGNKLEVIISDGNVTIKRGIDLTAKANRAEYDVEKNIITLIGSPEIIDKQNKLMADKITFYVNENRSVADGNVRVDFVGTK